MDTFRTTDTGNNTDTYCNARANADHRTETTAWVNIYSCSYTNGSFSVAVVVPDLNVGSQTVDVSVGSVGYSGPVDNSLDRFADPTLEVIANSLKRQSVDDLASLDSNIDIVQLCDRCPWIFSTVNNISRFLPTITRDQSLWCSGLPPWGCISCRSIPPRFFTNVNLRVGA